MFIKTKVINSCHNIEVNLINLKLHGQQYIDHTIIIVIIIIAYRYLKEHCYE